MWQRLRTLLGFFLIPTIASFAMLFSIPVLITAGGTDAWAAVAVSQGVGATAALCVGLGWATTGPAMVARTPTREHNHLYWLSVASRAPMLVVVAPMAVLASLLLTRADLNLLAVLVTIAVTLQGLSPGWFLIGRVQPYILAAVETAPRALAILAAVGMVAITDAVVSYGIVVLATEILIAGGSWARYSRRDLAAGGAVEQVRDVVQEQWPLVIAALAGAGYTRAAVPIVSAVAFPAVPVFAALDRVQQFGRTGVRPVASFFQGWVARPGQKRPLVATVVTVGTGALVGAVIAVTLPIVDAWIFTEAIPISQMQATLLGLTVASIAGSMSTGLYFLVPRGALRVFSWTSTSGAIIGLPLLLWLSVTGGATGAMAAVLIVELLVVTAQAIYVFSTRGRAAPSAPDG